MFHSPAGAIFLMLGRFLLQGARGLFLSGLLAMAVDAQGIPETGEPFLRNYPPQEYGAFYQNWDIVQDPKGLVYTANNSGVLEFDGARWRVYPLPSRTVVRSLAVDARGRIYAGALGDIGYLDRDPRGELAFRSLRPQLDPAERNLSLVLGVKPLGDRVFFLTVERLFALQGPRVHSWASVGGFRRLWVVRDQLYVWDGTRGLLTLRDGQLVAVPSLARLTEDRIVGLEPWPVPGAGEQGLLLVSGSQGLFLHDGQTLRAFPTQADAVLKTARVNHAIVLSDGSLGIATLKRGFLHLGPDGRWLGSVGREEGLPNLTLHRLMQDHQGGVWLVHGKGLARLEVPSPLSRFGESRGLKGIIYTCLRHQGTLFVGTDQGLFQLAGEGPDAARFQPVEGFHGTVGQLCAWGDSLLVANQFSLMALRGGRLREVWKFPAAINHLYRSKVQPDRLFVAMQNRLEILRNEGERWFQEGPVNGVGAMVCSFHEAEDGSLWLGSFSHGILRIAPPWQAPAPIKSYGVAEGLPSLNHTNVHELGGTLRVSTHAGIYRYRQDQDRFEPDPAFRLLFPEGPRWLYTPMEDASGGIWMHSCDEARGIQASGVARPGADGLYRWDGRAVARASGGWVERVYPEAHGVVWFCGSEGMVRLDQRIAKPYDFPLQTLVRGLTVGSGKRDLGSLEGQPPPRIPFRENQLRLTFALPSLEAESTTQYQVLLEGHDRDWSAWSTESFRDYTNLTEGSYRFRVRGRNLYGVVGSEAHVAFTILPPWYRTFWAYGLYLLGFGVLGQGLVRGRSRVLEHRNQVLEGKVRERTEHLEKLNSIVESINGKTELDALLKAILRETQVIRGAERASVLLRVRAGNTFRFHAGRGWDTPAHKDIEQTLEELELTLEEAEARYTQNAAEISEDIFVIQTFDGRAGQAKLGGVAIQQAMLAMRICIEGRVEAYFIFDNEHDPKAFNSHDLDLLKGLRSHFVSAIMKARIMDDLRQAKDAAVQAGQELQRANERLYQLNDEKNRIIGVAAHDLRNPLSGIQLSCEVLRDALEPDLAPNLDRIQALGRGMNDLIQELLDVHAIEANAAESPTLEPMDPAALLAETHRAYRTRAEAKQIDLILEPGSAAIVWADTRHLQRVLDNLVSNAVKYSPSGRRVWMRAVGDGTGVRLEVQDEGPGLTPEDQARAFAAYGRLSAQPTAGEPSVGLGLSIVKKLVEGMGGTLGVTSVAGQGATFWVRLPHAALD